MFDSFWGPIGILSCWGGMLLGLAYLKYYIEKI